MKRVMFLALGGALLIAVGARGSDPVGIYALINKVVLEPKEGTPERIKIWGVFVLASERGNRHTSPSHASASQNRVSTGSSSSCGG